MYTMLKITTGKRQLQLKLLELEICRDLTGERNGDNCKS